MKWVSSKAYVQYLLWVLTAVYACTFLERQALGITLQDIKLELSLSDAQIGLLTGIASTFFFAVLGVAIARWADRGNRVLIISIAAVLQSAAVALHGLAGSFFQLLAVRIMVSVGEAGCVPPAQSLISDYFSREERPRALSRYMLGVPIALTLGFLAAGWLEQLYGWRNTFVLLSIPGLVLASIVWFTLTEPRLSSVQVKPTADPPGPNFSEVIRALWASRAFRHLMVCYSVWYFFGMGITKWLPTFFIRSHGFEAGELGMWLAAVYGVGAGVGVYLGGELTARYASANERRQLNACAAIFTVLMVVEAYAYVTRSAYISLGMLALANVVGGMALAPLYATIQSLAAPPMRATALAFVLLAGNLIGGGFGPLVAGALSDALHPLLGNESLRYALVILCPGYVWAAWHLWRAGRTIEEDMNAVRDGSNADKFPKELVLASDDAR